MTACAVTSAPRAFSVSTSNTDAGGADGTEATDFSAQNFPSNCNNDYVLFPGGFNPTVIPNVPTNAVDRFCGEAFNPLYTAATTSVTVCSKFN